MLTAGSRLGPYEILGALGAGGMGEVYKARDTRLDRTVAIKVLPDAFAADPHFRERFDREARVISQLTHPHICTLHDVGEHEGAAYLVMEYLEGQTLADRLDASAAAGTRGLSLDEALQIAMQIADALDKAHRAGVVHRDLKPGNIMLIRSSARSAAGPQAKLLDFGLAKTGASSAAAAGLSMLPTTPPNLTAQGTILGTFQYMAPEQLEGGEADARTDLFAFGLILYEMVTGRKVFEGKSQAALIAAVLEHPAPPMSSVDRTLPPALEDVVQGCLAKDPEDRWQSARDVLRQLKRVSQPSPDNRAAPAATPAVPARRWSADRVIALGAALLIGAAAASGYWWMRGSSASAPSSPMHLSLMLAQSATAAGTNAGVDAGIDISPDGKWIAYTAARDGRQFLYLRGIAEPAGRAIEGTDNSSRPFFSPDSQWIAFASGNALKKVPVSGGSPVSLCSLSGTNSYSSGFVGGAWGADDTIVFVPQFNDGIFAVPANGGTARLLLKTDESKDRIAYLYPQVLPRGRGILFTVVPNRAREAGERDTAVLEAGATEPRTVIRGGSNARFVPTGHLVYSRGDELLGIAFDLARLDVTGTPVPVVSGVQQTPLGDVSFAIASAGTLLYEPSSGPAPQGLLAVVDRKGGSRAVPDSRGRPADFSVSSDGRSVAVRMAAQNDDLWTYDVEHGSPLRLTFEPGDELWPQWTPDGKRIAFGTRTGKIFLKPADGAAQRELISSGEFPRMPTSISPDGKMLAFTELHPTGKRDVLLLPLAGGKPEPFAVTEADESQAKFSPDGRWIAYTSNETGRSEIFIRPVGAPGGRRRVSSGGGRDAAWSRSSRELFFLKGDSLFSVGLDARGETVEGERMVLEAPKLDDFFLVMDPDMPAYDVLPDGNHFVMRLSQQSKPPTHYDVVVNWFEELRRLVPAASR